MNVFLKACTPLFHINIDVYYPVRVLIRPTPPFLWTCSVSSRGISSCFSRWPLSTSFILFVLSLQCCHSCVLCPSWLLAAKQNWTLHFSIIFSMHCMNERLDFTVVHIDRRWGRAWQIAAGKLNAHSNKKTTNNHFMFHSFHSANVFFN